MLFGVKIFQTLKTIRTINLKTLG